MKALVEMENSGLVPMLRDDKFDDLARMYQLLRKVDGGALLIRSVMSDYVKEVGKQLVQDPEKCKVRMDVLPLPLLPSLAQRACILWTCSQTLNGNPGGL